MDALLDFQGDRKFSEKKIPPYHEEEIKVVSGRKKKDPCVWINFFLKSSGKIFPVKVMKKENSTRVTGKIHSYSNFLPQPGNLMVHP